jgi:hypothetical protein
MSLTDSSESLKETVDASPDAKIESKSSLPENDALDHVLQTLVDLTNRSDLELGITLTVGGFSISGMLVSGKTFFDGLAAEMSASIDEPSSKKAVHEYFSNFGGAYNFSDDDHDTPLPIFIHLRDARHFHNSGGPMPGNRGVYWRGRISQVSGFSMGNLSADRDRG